MPIVSQSIIVGGGAELLAPVTIGNIPLISSIGPPGTLSNSTLRQWTDGAVDVITIGAVDVRPGIGATETLRLSGGLISAGVATDSLVIGRGAGVAAGATDGIAIGRGATVGAAAVDSLAIGRGASAVGAPAIAIGRTASAPAINCISIGGTSTNASAAVVIGFSASATANGGSPQLIAIGTSASAGRSVGGIVSLAIGASSVAREDDLVIGHGASSNQGTASNGNTVVGHSATVNVSASFSTVIGRLSVVSAGVRSVIVGSSSNTSATQCIILGSGISNSVANRCFIGGPSTDIQGLFIGAGTSIASPAARTVSFTVASGTNNAAGNITFAAARSTGNATPAQFVFTVGTVGASGAVVQTAIDMLRLGDNVCIIGTADPGGGTELLRVNGALRVNAATMIATSTPFTDGAAAALGTLNNAPTAGDPTKWIPVDDNGTVRFIPAW